MDYLKNNRVFSLLGQRGTFGTVLKELAGENDKIIAISADLTRTSGLEQFAALYPERMYNVGIAEENAVGMAAGLADQGYVPFVTTFSNFATLRANEFVRHFMAYMNCNVKLVGFGSGFAMEFFGNTHYGLEDISTIRSMPNLMIFSPADGLEVAKTVDYVSKHTGPVYIRLSGKMNNPMVHKTDFDFVPGKALLLEEGEDVVLFATGSMVSVSMKARKILAENGIDVEMIEQMIADAGFDQIRIGLQEERDQELEMISAGFKLNDGVKLVCTCGAKDPEDFSYQFWCSSFDCGPDEGIFRCRKCNRYFKVDKDNNQTERD